MDFEDVFDLVYAGFEIPEYIYSAIGLITTITIIGIVGLLVAAWAFCGLTRRNIGRKAGLTKDWMAFVPFARTVYLLEVVGEQWWKMFIFEMWVFWYTIIVLFFGLFNSQAALTFGYVIAALYLVAVVAYKIYFRIKFCKAFSIKSDFALSEATVWGYGFLRRVFECLIAYTNLFQYGYASNQRGFGEVTVPGPRTPNQYARAASGAAGTSSAACSITGLSGMYAGQDIPMVANDELIIGRDASLANVIIDTMADKVSRKHCGIRYDAQRGVYMVTDYSSNGTFIDGGSRLASNIAQPCNRGTVISLGSRENRFKLN